MAEITIWITIWITSQNRTGNQSMERDARKLAPLIVAVTDHQPRECIS